MCDKTDSSFVADSVVSVCLPSAGGEIPHFCLPQAGLGRNRPLSAPPRHPSLRMSRYYSEFGKDIIRCELNWEITHLQEQRRDVHALLYGAAAFLQANL